MELFTLQSERKLTQPSKRAKTRSQVEPTPSTCRYCQHYKFQGHRHGYCIQLGVQVCSHWRFCPLALPPFVPS